MFCCSSTLKHAMKSDIKVSSESSLFQIQGDLRFHVLSYTQESCVCHFSHSDELRFRCTESGMNCRECAVLHERFKAGKPISRGSVHWRQLKADAAVNIRDRFPKYLHPTTLESMASIQCHIYIANQNSKSENQRH